MKNKVYNPEDSHRIQQIATIRNDAVHQEKINVEFEDLKENMDWVSRFCKKYPIEVRLRATFDGAAKSFASKGESHL